MGQHGVFSIEPETVEQAAQIIADSGDALHGAGKSLQVTGVPLPTALPGGLAFAALGVAAVTVGGVTAGEGTALSGTAAGLRSYLTAVTTADRESADALGGCRP